MIHGKLEIIGQRYPAHRAVRVTRELGGDRLDLRVLQQRLAVQLGRRQVPRVRSLIVLGAPYRHP